jgi:hypothetical protein
MQLSDEQSLQSQKSLYSGKSTKSCVTMSNSVMFNISFKFCVFSLSNIIDCHSLSQAPKYLTDLDVFIGRETLYTFTSKN